MGWIGAAHSLRRKHFPDLKWDDPKVRACTSRGFEILFKAHRGSFPPLPGHAAHPAQLSTPSIRPDQTTAS